MAKKVITRAAAVNMKAGAKRKAKVPPSPEGRGTKSHESASRAFKSKPDLVQGLGAETAFADALDEAEKLVRAYPLPAIGAGLTIGLLLGLLLGRSS